MKVQYSFEREFEELMSDLLSKYGYEMFQMDGLGDQLDVVKFTEDFVRRGIIESTIDANANVRVTNISTYFIEISKPHTYLYSLYRIWQKMKEMFGKEIADEFVEAQINGAVYLHDRHHAALMPYCFAYTLQPIVEKGLPFIKTIKSEPAKHLSTFIQHVIQFVMFASNQSSGAVGLPDFFVWMWYFVKKDLEEGIIPRDKLDWYIEQHFQILTYSLNQPIRTTQSPYTNFTYLDRNYIKAIFEGERYPDGSLITDHVEDIIALQKHYWEWVSRERERQMFTFPVLTASLLYKDGKFLDEDSARFINKINMKWQDTNWYISDSIDAVASCCRLTSSTQTLKKFSLSSEEEEKLKGRMNSIGGSDLNIGSFKVITVNLPRIALESSGDREKYLQILRHRVQLIKKALAAIREIIKERISEGLLPLYENGLMLLNRQYGTIGITGVWESASIMGLTTEDIDGLKYTEEGEKFIDSVLDIIREEAEKGYHEYGFTFNIEQVPAEKAAVTLAQKDRFLFGEKQPFEIYSNQWVPLMANTDVLNRIRYSGKWDKKVSGGAILHINLGEPFKTEEESFNMVKMIADMGVMYFAFNTKISVCEDGHAFYGERCPVCGKAKVDEYMRIVGYLVPVSAFNKERREIEYPRRQFYDSLTIRK
ncbi:MULTISPECIES: anaerobic ribonucleoside-triphosphate reductase [unclassified Thermotoga]|uniref:anaerobic ribonucleoside-triphosphate reductase n=1 Tax=unclassified Thermotoga TaxID=2631113 RepID=UPI000280E74F|nr:MULTISPECIES: anaerobic ribonucleoside-triphosphate reductase [unclassified Thermotoga]AIY86110.1 anaerobic ribonucleoside triphosphate reductase [Thermotoga sp. 2812B]EJX26370.1 anaerobic ribonucleoside triphosphate reductase [Thermotoga sp. EMP]